MTVSAFPKLNNTVLSCEDGDSNGDMQSTVISIYGKISIYGSCFHYLIRYLESNVSKTRVQGFL